MTRLFKETENATVGDILAFVGGAAEEGADAAVPAGCLPVLAVHGGLKPNGKGEFAACFVFPCGRSARARVGWGERVAAFALLVALSPFLLALALTVWLVDGRPVLFLQERYGVGGRPFRMWKFRTMVPQAAHLHRRLQARHAQRGRLFKLERDPRVTRTGLFLRRVFADELPQLANIVRGDMRFLGPRPLPACDQLHYTRPEHALRLEGLPGITGLWQVAGRNARTFDEMCLLDIYYLRNRSWRLDAWLLVRTVGLLLKQISLKGEAEDGRK